MPEDEHVNVREGGCHALVATSARPRVVDDGQAQAVQVSAGHLGQPCLQLRPVVVADDADHAGGPLLQPVEEVQLDPVAGVDDDVGPGDLVPDRSGQVAGALGDMCVGEQ